MTKSIVLIISDNPERRQLIATQFEYARMAPVGYPEPGAHVLDLDGRAPQVVVVDLEGSGDVALEHAQRALDQYTHLKVITIGRRIELERHGHFAGIKNVAMCDRVEELWQ